MNRLLLGITGATGMLYLPPFLRLLAEAGVTAHGIISDAGRQVLRHELGQEAETLPHVSRWFDIHDFTAPPSSGSSLYEAMVILPCTMGSLAAIASGFCAHLIHRCADVSLKERRPLILCLRETPLNRTHLKNMLTACEAGATLCPLMPAFYSHPGNLEEMAASLAVRICDLLGITVAEKTAKRWQGIEYD